MSRRAKYRRNYSYPSGFKGTYTNLHVRSRVINKIRNHVPPPTVADRPALTLSTCCGLIALIQLFLCFSWWEVSLVCVFFFSVPRPPDDGTRRRSRRRSVQDEITSTPYANQILSQVHFFPLQSSRFVRDNNVTPSAAPKMVTKRKFRQQQLVQVICQCGCGNVSKHSHVTYKYNSGCRYFRLA